MNKLKGILFLKQNSLPTIDLISFENIMKEDYIIEQGLSVRLSNKKNENIDVNLPSIHNCYNKAEIKKFVNMYSKNYNVLIHKTVKPTLIGSISKYNVNKQDKIVIEIFNDFVERKQEIIYTREMFELVGDHYLRPETNSGKYIEIANLVKNIPLGCFDIEFVVENNQIIFTDFYSKEYTNII